MNLPAIFRRKICNGVDKEIYDIERNHCIVKIGRISLSLALKKAMIPLSIWFYDVINLSLPLLFLFFFFLAFAFTFTCISPSLPLSFIHSFFHHQSPLLVWLIIFSNLPLLLHLDHHLYRSSHLNYCVFVLQVFFPLSLFICVCSISSTRTNYTHTYIYIIISYSAYAMDLL